MRLEERQSLPRFYTLWLFLMETCDWRNQIDLRWSSRGLFFLSVTNNKRKSAFTQTSAAFCRLMFKSVCTKHPSQDQANWLLCFRSELLRSNSGSSRTITSWEREKIQNTLLSPSASEAATASVVVVAAQCLKSFCIWFSHRGLQALGWESLSASLIKTERYKVLHY